MSKSTKKLMKELRFRYFKSKILEHLSALEEKEKKEAREVSKALDVLEGLRKAGFPVGTVREWKGKKFVKIAPGKWRPKYDGHSRGAKLSIAAIKKKAAACKTSRELLQLVLEHKSRFADKDGHPLPFVRELSEYVSSLNDKLEAGGVSEGKTARPAKAAASNKKTGNKAEAKKTATEKDVLAVYSKEYRKLYNSEEVPGQYAKANDRFDNLMKNSAAFKDYVVKLARIRQDGFSSDREVAALMAALNKTGKLADLSTMHHITPSSGKKKSNDIARKEIKEVLASVKNKDLLNESTGMTARISIAGINKMTSGAAIKKTIENGFSGEDHFEAVKNIVELWRKAKFVAKHRDRNGSANLAINRFVAQGKTKDGKDYDALITVKETIENGRRIYSLELDKIDRASLRWAVNKDETPSSQGRAPTGSSSSTLPQPGDSVKQKNTAGKTPTAGGGVHEEAPTSDSNLPQSGDSVKEKDAKPSGIAAIRAKYEAEKSVTGSKKTVTLPDGSKIKCHYKLVEAEAPSASHNEVTFAPTEGFPTNSGGKNINDRDYQHDLDAQESVRRIAADFNSLALQSPPVVTKDGIVISGNNRTMSSKLAARNGTDKAYLEDLREMADEFGLEASDLDGFRHPRLILEVDAEHEGAYTTEEFAAFNQNTKKTMNNIEKAVKITKTLNKEKITGIAHCLDGYETMGELYQDKKGGGKLVQELVKAGVILENEKAQYLTSDGLLNDTGKDFVETVLVGSVLSEENIRSCDSAGGKSIRKKLIRAILPLIENKGTGKEYSFNAELNEAVSIALAVSKHHDQFQNVQDYLAQGNLFEGKKPDAVTSRLAELIHDETEKAFAARMKGLSAGLRDSAEGLQDIFLEGVETKDALMRRFLEMKKALALAVKNALEKVFRESA